MKVYVVISPPPYYDTDSTVEGVFSSEELAELFIRDGHNKKYWWNCDIEEREVDNPKLVKKWSTTGMNHLMLERVYQGGRDAIANMQKGDGVLSVLLEQEMSRTFVNPNLKHKLIPFPDAQPFPLDKILEGVLWVEQFLSENKDKKVLVHCAEGNSRSLAVILAILLGRGKKLDEAINHIVTVKNMCTEGGRYVNEKQIDRINKSWGKFPKDLESYLNGLRAFKCDGRFIVFHFDGDLEKR